MSGIAGVWNLDGRPLRSALLRRLGDALAHRGPDGQGDWTETTVGLVCRLSRVTPESVHERQPVVGATGAVLVFDGRLDNRDELLACLGEARGLSRDVADAGLALAAYERFGDDFAARLAGDFALAVFESRRQRLLLVRDPIGVRPLYYHRSPRLVAFASEIKALLAHPEIVVRADDEHLARFLLDDIRGREASTFFDGIRAVPPATIATVTHAGVAARRYWDFDPAARAYVGSFADCAAAFRHHLETAVRRRLRSAHPVAVSVSGGLDSSSIFCLAHRLTSASGRPPVAGISYISPAGSPADERQFLDVIEDEYGVAIERLPVEPMGLLGSGRRAVWHVETPMVDEQWQTTVALHEAVRRRGCRVMLTGHWADQIVFDQAYLVDLLRRRAWRQARTHLAEYPRWFTDAEPRSFRRRFLLDLVKYALPAPLRSVLRRLRPREHARWYGPRLTARRRPWPAPDGWGEAQATAQARSIYEQVRSPYHLLCMEWNDKLAAARGFEVAFPFLDRDLLSFVIALPGEMLTWQGVPKGLLRAAMRGVLPEAIAARRWKADFTSLVNEGMERDFLPAARLVAGGLAARLGYLDRDAIREELDRVRQGLGGTDARAAWRLSDVLGLELWLQVFVGGARADAKDGLSPDGPDERNGGHHEIDAAPATEEAVPRAPADRPR